jgi:D-amino-acid oxidase
VARRRLGRYGRRVTRPAPDVLVVGAGVIGLTTGICLAEAGLRVLIRAGQRPADTTSAVAGAIWGPHLVEESERATRWGQATLAVLREQAADPATGVRPASGLQAVREPGSGGQDGPPDWAARLGVRAADPAELPAGFTGGWRYSAPLVHMPTYLGYLLARFGSAGGSLEPATVSSLAAAGRDARAGAVVNCTGTGARALAADPALTPVRGQAVVVANPGLAGFFIGQAGPGGELVYLFPHGDVTVLGGTTVAGDWSREPDPAVAARILRDCAAVEPRLRSPQVLAHRVGLRPARPAVRLEAGPGSPGGPPVLHNYGHGGAGVTLSWGCAADIAALTAHALP